MYSNKLVVALKQNGKILREYSDTVFLPFGSEYSLLVKNLNSRKASVNISIDGEDVLSNKSLLIYPNSETELKGFMNGMTAKNKFKFIKKTEEISNYRGDRIDDGLIRVEFAFEKKVSETVCHHCKSYYDNESWYWPWKPWRSYEPTYYNCTKYTDGSSFTVNQKNNIGKRDFSFSSNVFGNNSKSYNSTNFNNDGINDSGITVKGSEINQDFTYGNIGELEQNHVMVIKLCGKKSNGNVVEKPITVKTKLICPTCGKKSRSDVRYCSRCGTFLDS